LSRTSTESADNTPGKKKSEQRSAASPGKSTEAKQKSEGLFDFFVEHQFIVDAHTIGHMWLAGAEVGPCSCRLQVH